MELEFRSEIGRGKVMEREFLEGDRGWGLGGDGMEKETEKEIYSIKNNKKIDGREEDLAGRKI